jgi:hypothetical protein
MNNYGDYGAAEGYGAAAAVSGGMMFFNLIVAVFFAVCLWKIFVKAGKPGWAAIIPIYNCIVMFEIVGMPSWYVVLLFVPIVNIVIAIKMVIKLAKAFGKSGAYAAGLIFLPVIFYPMLAFGKSQYVGMGTMATPASAPTAPMAQ